MLKECAATAITNTEEPKNHGIALMKNFTLTECARIATSILTTEKEEKKKLRKRTIKCSAKVN